MRHRLFSLTSPAIWTTGIVAILVVCFATMLDGQVVAIRAELVGGPWEMASESGTDGIFVKIAQGGTDARTISRQTIQVRVYHRKSGGETWGWYVVSPPADALATFDGKQLRVVGLTATFDPDTVRWTGRWSLDGQTKEVVLERPHRASDVRGNPLCGDWEGLPDTTRGLASTTLHIVQSSDGTVSAWLDRVLAVQDQRFGEPFKVISANPSNVTLELDTPIGPLYRFSGVLASDGNSIAGHWNGLNARENFRRLR